MVKPSEVMEFRELVNFRPELPTLKAAGIPFPIRKMLGVLALTQGDEGSETAVRRSEWGKMGSSAG